jgi:hypothetical protein
MKDMKGLLINYAVPRHVLDRYEGSLTTSHFAYTTPFGYDFLLIDPDYIPSIVGMDDHASTLQVIENWKKHLDDWLGQGNILIVIHRPYYCDSHGIDNYSWLPLSDAGLLIGKSTSTGGQTHDIGMINDRSSLFSTYLSEDSFRVPAYYEHDSESDHEVQPISSIVKDRLTAFCIKDDNHGPIYFLPEPIIAGGLIDYLMKKADFNLPIKIKEIPLFESALKEATDQLEISRQQVSKSEDDLSRTKQRVIELISGDVYLERAVKLLTSVRTSEAPDPRDYYEAVENIEKAFGGERKMRDALNIPKGEHDLLMRRTNDFRHAQKESKEPLALTADEVDSFSKLTTQILEAYLQYLYQRQFGT